MAYADMNKGPLLDAIKENGLEDKVEALDKHESKITKADLVKILEEFGPEIEVEVVDRKIVADDFIREEFGKLGRVVIVTDHNTKTSTEEEIRGKLTQVQVGNNIVGKERHTVLLDGQPQLLANSVIRKLSKIMINTVGTPEGNTKKHEVHTRKRFSIAEVTAPTEEELKALAEKQKLHVKRA